MSNRITYQYSYKCFRQLFENSELVGVEIGCGLLHYNCWQSSELQWPARRSISSRNKFSHYSDSVICEIMA